MVLGVTYLVINYYACSQNILTSANGKTSFPSALCSKEVKHALRRTIFLSFPFQESLLWTLSYLYILFMTLSLN